MVNRKVLEKLSNHELQLYIKENSRYVSEAITIAYDILKKRGHVFSDSEIKTIENLIHQRKTEENQKREEDEDIFLEKNIIEDQNAISLYPFHWLGLGSIFLTTIFGGILLFINCLKLKKNVSGIILLFVISPFLGTFKSRVFD